MLTFCLILFIQLTTRIRGYANSRIKKKARGKGSKRQEICDDDQEAENPDERTRWREA